MDSLKNSIIAFLEEKHLDRFLADKIKQYIRLLQEINTRINLTARHSSEDIFYKHIRELFELIPYARSSRQILDLGSGAGYTGITLKILFPQIEIYFLDSKQKKIEAVADICRDMEMTKIHYIIRRAEEAAHDMHFREQFDLVVTRAVASAPVTLELAAPFVKKNGIFAHYTTCQYRFYKDNSIISLLGLELENTKKYEKNSSKLLQILGKKKNTPHQYPRRYSVIKRKPLDIG